MQNNPIHSTEPATESRNCERWLTSLTDVVTVTAWHDPVVESAVGAIATASDEAMITGRVGLFVWCECFCGGVL